MGSKGKLICGVGINDSDYTLHKFGIVGGSKKRIWICPYYQSWHGIFLRCYSEDYLSRRPTYVGCSVHPDWHKFSVFKEWMERQPWEGNALDKDLLVTGNKIYGPDTCVFIPQALNNFLGDCGRSRGKYPIGVSLHKRTRTLRADCNNPFTHKAESLGHFLCVNAAHEAWRIRKHQLACQYADIQQDQRIAEALRTRYLPDVEHK